MKSEDEDKLEEEYKTLGKGVSIFLFGMCVLFFAVIITLSSCSTTKCVPEIIVHDSIHTEYAVKYDSTYIFKHDSIFIKDKGDSVIVTKFHTIYRDKYVLQHDTVYKSVDHKVVNNVTTNVLTSAQKGMIRGFWWLLILLVLAVLGVAGYFVAKKTTWGKAAVIAVKTFLKL